MGIPGCNDVAKLYRTLRNPNQKIIPWFATRCSEVPLISISLQERIRGFQLTLLGSCSPWMPDVHGEDGEEHGTSIKHIHKPFMVFDVVRPWTSFGCCKFNQAVNDPILKRVSH
jgi:hypothetical protein